MKKFSVLALGLVLCAGLSVARADEGTVPEYKISAEAVKAGEARLALASALISVLDAGKVCEADAYPSEINNLVEGAQVSLESKVVQAWAAQSIPMNSKIRQDLQFRQNLNYVQLDAKVVDVAAVVKQLTGTKFYGFGAGAMGSSRNVELMPGGVAMKRVMNMLEEEPYFEWVNTALTWEVVVQQTQFGFEEALLKIDSMLYKFEQQSGQIWLVPVGIPEDEKPGHTLTTTDSYCEA